HREDESVRAGECDRNQEQQGILAQVRCLKWKGGVTLGTLGLSRQNPLTICPEIGRKMVAIAELLANSVVNDARRLMMTTTADTGNSLILIRCPPISRVRPEL